MPETQVKRLQGLSIKIIKNLFAVSIKVFIFAHKDSLSICVVLISATA